MSNRDPNSKDESSPSGVDRREKIMKETNDEDKTEQSRPVGHSRRDFIVSAATAVASVGAANLLNLQPAQSYLWNDADAMKRLANQVDLLISTGPKAYPMSRSSTSSSRMQPGEGNTKEPAELQL